MKVILIGMGIDWKKAPMEGETWGLNGLILRRPVKRMFLMHAIDKGKQLYGDKYPRIIEAVNKLDIPVMTLEKCEELPNSVKFPLDEMPSRYFTNSFAYMIAYAIYMGATSIDLYAVPIVSKVEYREQRACIEYWIGYARGKGIEVTIFGGSTLFSIFLHAGLYGYEWNQDYQKIP